MPRSSSASSRRSGKSGAWLSASSREFLNSLECQGRLVSERDPKREAASMAGRPRRPSRSRKGLSPCASRPEHHSKFCSRNPAGSPGVRRRPKAPRTRPRFVTCPDPPGTPAPQIRAPGGATLKPSSMQGCDGPGFVLTDHENLCGIDLDWCFDPATGQLRPWAQEIVDSCGSYTELVPHRGQGCARVGNRR